MKKEMSVKKKRILWFATGVIWLANAILNGWSIFARWEQMVDSGQVVARSMTILLSLACATVNFLNWYRLKGTE